MHTTSLVSRLTAAVPAFRGCGLNPSRLLHPSSPRLRFHGEKSQGKQTKGVYLAAERRMTRALYGDRLDRLAKKAEKKRNSPKVLEEKRRQDEQEAREIAQGKRVPRGGSSR